MSQITIDSDLCTRDGHCVAECPPLIIQIEDDIPFITKEMEENCIDCGHCVAVCPVAALTLSTLSPAECPPVDKAMKLSEEQATQFLRSRRSIRNYKEKPVEPETLQKLIEIARHAPTASNKQPVQWLILKTPGDVQKVAELTTDWMREMVEKLPEVAAELKLERIIATQESGVDRICRGAPHLAFAFADKSFSSGETDCAIALSYMELLLPALGLGGCWAGYVKHAAQWFSPLTQFLDLPENSVCHGVMMIGYPRYRYHRLPIRREASVIWR